MNEELPMVVWLRGDESYFGEFSLDADEVMRLLGIRRSRLTQISGRELRVGRTRVDRYVRPIYRSCDIEEYINWTRPTASHKKSSSVLSEAADKLTHVSGEFSAHMQQALLASTKRSWERQVQALRGGFTKAASRTLESERAQLRSQALLREDLQRLHSEIGTLQARVADYAGLPAAVSELMGTLQFLTKAVLHLQKSVDELRASEPPKPPRRPHRLSPSGRPVRSVQEPKKSVAKPPRQHRRKRGGRV